MVQGTVMLGTASRGPANCSAREQESGPGISHLTKYITINKGKGLFSYHKPPRFFINIALLLSVRIYPVAS